MPFLLGGGIFLPRVMDAQTAKRPETACTLNDELCLLIGLFDEPQTYCCMTKIVWVTPAMQAAGQLEGVGLQFDRNDHQIKPLIESMLANHQADSVQSQTL